jgi:EAL domain-containing protein (putative c-di-GMP-specific phosphodiesterase class I)
VARILIVDDDSDVRRKQRLVELLVLFAKATGTQLVVEGIETEEEAGVVTRMGADLLQGFLYGRPTPSPSSTRSLP